MDNSKYNFYNPMMIINQQNGNSFLHTQATFKALVDAIIPQTPELAEEYEQIQYLGALDLFTYEYMMWTLNNYLVVSTDEIVTEVLLAEPVAEMLDIAAEQLVTLGENKNLLNFSRFPEGGPFAALSPEDRFRAIELLGEPRVDLGELPLPFKEDAEFVLSVSRTLNRFPLMGYYSEWSGYEGTRLASPNERVLKIFPLDWRQVGYPGPSIGYPAFRGYLVKEFTE